MSLRVFHRDSMQPGQTITLEAAESHYLARVRRARAGATVEVLDGVAFAFRGEVLAIDPSASTIRIDAVVESTRTPSIEIAIGLPDPTATLDALQRACELGAARAVLVRCEHSHAAQPGDDRIRRVLEASQRQCGRPDPIVVDGPIALDAWLELETEASGFVALRDGTSPVAPPRDAAARVVVGPEGGLTEREVAQARSRGFEAISLGPWTLRTEVAVVAALSILLHASGHEHGHGQGHGETRGDAR